MRCRGVVVTVHPSIKRRSAYSKLNFLMRRLTEDSTYSRAALIKNKRFHTKIGERLICFKDNRSKTLQCDTHAIGVHKKVEEPDDKLKFVGRVPIEC